MIPNPKNFYPLMFIYVGLIKCQYIEYVSNPQIYKWIVNNPINDNTNCSHQCIIVMIDGFQYKATFLQQNIWYLIMPQKFAWTVYCNGSCYNNTVVLQKSNHYHEMHSNSSDSTLLNSTNGNALFKVPRFDQKIKVNFNIDWINITNDKLTNSHKNCTGYLHPVYFTTGTCEKDAILPQFKLSGGYSKCLLKYDQPHRYYFYVNRQDTAFIWINNECENRYLNVEYSYSEIVSDASRTFPMQNWLLIIALTIAAVRIIS